MKNVLQRWKLHFHYHFSRSTDICIHRKDCLQDFGLVRSPFSTSLSLSLLFSSSSYCPSSMSVIFSWLSACSQNGWIANNTFSACNLVSWGLEPPSSVYNPAIKTVPVPLKTCAVSVVFNIFEKRFSGRLAINLNFLLFDWVGLSSSFYVTNVHVYVSIPFLALLRSCFVVRFIL